MEIQMFLYLLFFIVFSLIAKIGYYFLNHETFFCVGNRTALLIRTCGVFHYTTKESAKRILATQSLKGYPDKKSTFPKRRKRHIIWLLLNSNTIIQRFFRKLIIKRHCPIRPNGRDRTVKYEVKLLIKNINSKDIVNMYYNLECGIGCYAKALDNVKVSLAPLDDIDKGLGIVHSNELIEYLK